VLELRKKLVALILLFCLVASPFLLKLPAVKASPYEQNITINLDSRSIDYYSLGSGYSNFVMVIDLSNATFGSTYDTILQFVDSNDLYGWLMNENNGQLRFTDSYLTSESIFNFSPLSANYTMIFYGEVSGVGVEALNNGYEMTTTTSCSYITTENPITQIIFNPTNANNQVSGTINIQIDYFNVPTPTPTPSPTPSPTPTPTPIPYSGPTPISPSYTYSDLPTDYSSGGVQITTDSQYCYAAFYNQSTQGVAIVQLTDDGLTPVATWVTPNGDGINDFILSGNYLYADLESSTSFVGIAKIDTSTMETVSVLTAGFNFTEQNCYLNNFVAVNSNGDFIIQYWNNTDSTGYIGVLSSSDFSMLTNIEFLNGIFTQPYYSDGSLYIITSNNGYVLQTLDGESLAVTASVQLQENTELDTSSIVILNGYCYQSLFDGTADLGYVYQFDMSSGDLLGSFSEASYGLSETTIYLFTDGTNLYAALCFSPTNALLIQIDPNTMNPILVYGTSDTNGFDVWPPVLASVNGVEYVLAQDASTSAVFVYEFNANGSPVSTPTPSPSSGGHGGGSLSLFGSPTPSASGSPQPVPTPLKLNDLDLFGIAVAVVVVLGVAGLLLAHKGKRRRRR
jgi:hypothetical protein